MALVMFFLVDMNSSSFSTILLPDLGELQLAPQHLVLLLLQGSLGLGESGLQ